MLHAGAIQGLPCLLPCDRRGGEAQPGEETLRCQAQCARWNAVRGALEKLADPSVHFEELARAVYLEKEGGGGAEEGRELTCFLVCDKVKDENLVKAACARDCKAWQGVKKAVGVIGAEMPFDLFKDYFVRLNLASGTDVAEIMFIRFFEPPDEAAQPLPVSKLVLPEPSQTPSSSAAPGLFMRFCELNRWMGTIRFLLGGLVALLAATLQYAVGLDFPYTLLYGAALLTVGANALFQYRLRGHARRKLEVTRRCELCTPGFTQAQMIVDFLLLFCIVCLTGGLFSPAALFFFPHVIFSALLLSRPRRLANTALAVALYGAAFLLQALGLLPANAVTSVAAGFASRPLVLFLLWLAFSSYAVIIHYFTLKIAGELRGWQDEFLALHELQKDRSALYSRLNDRLTRMDTIRQRMVHVVSHDLKSPLSAVEGYLKVMLGGYYGNLNEKQIAALQRSAARLQGMREFINEILDVATIEKEGIRKELEVVDPTPLVRQVEEDSRWAAQDKRIRLSFACPERVPDILSSKARFLQVLQNLATNAIKFTPEGGEVAVAVEPREDEVLFSVRDSGMGISPEDQESIFVEFYRVKSVRQGDISGSGLGLFIVKSIVSAHGGRIWVESEIGKGSTFFFTMKRPVASEYAEVS